MRWDDASPTSPRPTVSSPAIKREDGPVCKAILRGIPFEKKKMPPKDRVKVSLLNGSKVDCSQFKPELLQRMDSLFAFYHNQWWCYRKLLNGYKFYNALFNGLALLLMAAGMIAGPILNNSTLVACLTAVGTVVKGWSELKKFSIKVDMCHFAYTTYAKALIDLRTYGHGIPFDGLEGFLVKMQTLDDTIVDFTPPLPKRCVQEYRTQFVYQPIKAHCYGDGHHRPLLSSGYWSEQGKKALGVVSPTITPSESWVDHEEKEELDDKGAERSLGL